MHFYDRNPNSPFYHLMTDRSKEAELLARYGEGYCKQVCASVKFSALCARFIGHEVGEDELNFYLYCALNAWYREEIIRSALLVRLGQDLDMLKVFARKKSMGHCYIDCFTKLDKNDLIVDRQSIIPYDTSEEDRELYDEFVFGSKYCIQTEEEYQRYRHLFYTNTWVLKNYLSERSQANLVEIEKAYILSSGQEFLRFYLHLANPHSGAQPPLDYEMLMLVSTMLYGMLYPSAGLLRTYVIPGDEDALDCHGFGLNYLGFHAYNLNLQKSIANLLSYRYLKDLNLPYSAMSFDGFAGEFFGVWHQVIQAKPLHVGNSISALLYMQVLAIVLGFEFKLDLALDDPYFIPSLKNWLKDNTYKEWSEEIFNTLPLLSYLERKKTFVLPLKKATVEAFRSASTAEEASSSESSGSYYQEEQLSQDQKNLQQEESPLTTSDASQLATEIDDEHLIYIPKSSTSAEVANGVASSTASYVAEEDRDTEDTIAEDVVAEDILVEEETEQTVDSLDTAEDASDLLDLFDQEMVTTISKLDDVEVTHFATGETLAPFIDFEEINTIPSLEEITIQDTQEALEDLVAIEDFLDLDNIEDLDQDQDLDQSSNLAANSLVADFADLLHVDDFDVELEPPVVDLSTSDQKEPKEEYKKEHKAERKASFAASLASIFATDEDDEDDAELADLEDSQTHKAQVLDPKIEQKISKLLPLVAKDKESRNAQLSSASVEREIEEEQVSKLISCQTKPRVRSQELYDFYYKDSKSWEDPALLDKEHQVLKTLKHKVLQQVPYLNKEGSTSTNASYLCEGPVIPSWLQPNLESNYCKSLYYRLSGDFFTGNTQTAPEFYEQLFSKVLVGKLLTYIPAESPEQSSQPLLYKIDRGTILQRINNAGTSTLLEALYHYDPQHFQSEVDLSSLSCNSTHHNLYGYGSIFSKDNLKICDIWSYFCAPLPTELPPILNPEDRNYHDKINLQQSIMDDYSQLQKNSSPTQSVLASSSASNQELYGQKQTEEKATIDLQALPLLIQLYPRSLLLLEQALESGNILIPEEEES